MASMDIDDVRHVAELARLRLDDPALERLRGPLQAILDYVSVLNGLDVEGEAPARATPSKRTPPREDRPRPSLSREAALSNAPDTVDGFFRVPPVLRG